MLKQWSEEPAGIAVAFIVFIAASLIPLFNTSGSSNGSQAVAAAGGDRFGPFTPQAEMINGRAAMIGFAALLVIEAVRGSALF